MDQKLQTCPPSRISNSQQVQEDSDLLFLTKRKKATNCMNWTNWISFHYELTWLLDKKCGVKFLVLDLEYYSWSHDDKENYTTHRLVII